LGMMAPLSWFNLQGVKRYLLRLYQRSALSRYERQAAYGIGLLQPQLRTVFSRQWEAIEAQRAVITGLQEGIAAIQQSRSQDMDKLQESLREERLAIRTGCLEDLSALRNEVRAELRPQLSSMEDVLSGLGRFRDSTISLCEEQRKGLQLMRRDLLSLQDIMERALPAGNDVNDPTRSGLAERLNAYYVAFEDFHRGSEDDLRVKLKPYLELFELYREDSQRRKILDVGCGRGEWLGLLGQQGIAAYGLDANPLMVAECRRRNLGVVESDVLGHLRGLPSSSLSGITGFHIVEHLPFEVLFGIFAEAYRVLAEGGIVAFETPNPENVLVGSHTFYHDFTHRNPVTPSSLSFLARYHNFEGIRILRLNPYPEGAKVSGHDPLTERVNGHLCGPQDFGLIAYKPRLERP
jgi:SAM-dependent methyltransferase